MGAIVAIWGGAGDSERSEQLERMLARSPYRGTAARHIEGNLAIGVQTLGWDASLATVGNWTVAHHGIIGNWEELAPIHAWRFSQSSSSATKIAIAYEHLGDDLFRQLRGPFTIIIHDRRCERLTVVRDLWAERPLFFEQNHDRTYFATEIRQVLAASKSSIEIDDDVLFQGMLWNPTYPSRTHIRGIDRVTAGRIQKFDRPQSRKPRDAGPIWTPPEEQTEPYNIDELAEELRFLIDQAVTRWLIGVPFVLGLSGGVDSATLWWTITQRLRNGDRRAAQARAISIAQPGDPNDESDQIRRIVLASGTQTTFVEFPLHDRVEMMKRNAESVDAPVHQIFSDCPTFSEETRSDGRQLVLSGFGGGLQLAGSFSYMHDLLAQRRFLTLLRDLLTIQPQPNKSRLLLIAGMAFSFLQRRTGGLAGRSQGEPSRLWLHESRIHQACGAGCERTRTTSGRQMSRHRFEVLKILEMNQSLAGQEACEQLSSSQGFVYGSPLVDIDVFDFALRVPPRALTDGKRRKHLLRMVAYNQFPTRVRRWRNRSADILFRDDEIETMWRLYPPDSWLLADRRIVDPTAIKTMYGAAHADTTVAWQLVEALTTEAVVRNLCCAETRNMAE